MNDEPIDPSAVAAVRAWRSLPRAARRAAWREANRLRGFEVIEGTQDVPRLERFPWTPHPSPTPLQAHMRTGRAGPYSHETLGVSLGFNRAQRRAMKAKSGPRQEAYKVIRRHVKQRRNKPEGRGRGEASLFVQRSMETGKVVRVGNMGGPLPLHDTKRLEPKVTTSVLWRPTQPYRLNKFALHRLRAQGVAERFKEIKRDQRWHLRLWRAFLRLLLKAARLFQSLTPWLNRRSR